MKRIPLPNETEDGWSVNPSSAEQVIEARLRREEHTKKLVRDAVKQSSNQFKRGTFGLSEAEIASIRWEALRSFLESATLPDEVRQQRARFRERFQERVERFLEMPERQRDAELSREAEIQAVLFARECEKAIARATGQFADMLTEAVIARRGGKDFSLDFRAKLWRECLEFAMGLNPALASEWADSAYGLDPREAPVPHLYRLDTMAEQQRESERFSRPFIKHFRERLRHASPDWLEEADRRITLRCLLSYAPGRPETPEDKSKKAVALLLIVTPGLATKEVCGKLDDHNERNPQNAPIPAPWKRKGARSWTDAYRCFPNLVQVYVSKVKKQFGKTASS